ncbi:hypothetical protein ACXR0O_27245 [Verrucomicrobiota bacterium sgz303538]
MKSHLHFYQRSIEISADEIRRFLRAYPHSSLTQIIEHICDTFSQLADTQRLKVWTEVRSILHRMEKKRMIRCIGGTAGNTWILDDQATDSGSNVGGYTRN